MSGFNIYNSWVTCVNTFCMVFILFEDYEEIDKAKDKNGLNFKSE
jgi:hypothetical protein